VKAIGVILAVAVALALQTTAARFLVRGSVAVDLVLVVVVYVSLTSGPATGLLSGTFAGLVQDALSSSVIGIGGLAKTLVGFLAGIIGTQFIVTASLPRFVVFFAATVLHAVVFMGAFQLVELLPGAVERRRAGKSRLRR
jgi:rod shape-determining protein MreD